MLMMMKAVCEFHLHYGPNKYVPNTPNVRNDLVSMLDLSATTLSWAGIQCPDYFEGQDLFSNDFKTRSFVGAHRDRLDHTIDKVRSVRTDTFRYVRNYLPTEFFCNHSIEIKCTILKIFMSCAKR